MGALSEFCIALYGVAQPTCSRVTTLKIPKQVGKVSFHWAKLSGTLSHRMAVEPCKI